VSTTVSKARRTAAFIGTVKLILVAVNALASTVYIVMGVSLAEGTESWTLEGGYVQHDNPFAAPIVIAGLVGLIFGTLVILAAGGFFQYMLLTNAEILARSEPGPAPILMRGDTQRPLPPLPDPGRSY
jgi:hypothetical protein